MGDSNDALWNNDIPDELLIAGADIIMGRGMDVAAERVVEVVPAPTPSVTVSKPRVKKALGTPTCPPSKRRKKKVVPVKVFRKGKLYVSDFMSQMWCELQMWKRFTEPQRKRVDTAEITKGTEMHLQRELEVQSYVDIKITSAEDIFAVKVLNLMHCLVGFQTNVKVCREIPIFGFLRDTLIMGKIDELRLDEKEFNIDIVEFKTRTTDSMPPQPQKDTHMLQVMIYKKLFDDLVLNKVSKYTLATAVKVKLDKALGRDVQKHLKGTASKVKNLDGLLDKLFEQFQRTPKISQLFVEYSNQSTGNTIGIEAVTYDEQWLNDVLTEQFSFWTGDRDAHGVDIEDMYKCDRCEYRDDCHWKKEMTSRAVTNEVVELSD